MEDPYRNPEAMAAHLRGKFDRPRLLNYLKAAESAHRGAKGDHMADFWRDTRAILEANDGVGRRDFDE